MGTVHVLEAVRNAGGVRVVVVVTSDKCYENREWVWGYRESDPMGGTDPYSSSKACAEHVVHAYRESFFHTAGHSGHGVAVASARAGNVIGGGDWGKDRLVPDMVRAFARSEQVRIRSPHAIRPWQHVLDPLCGYLMLVERLWQDGPEFAGGWNFGPDDSDVRPVSWVADRVAALWGSDAAWIADNSEHPHEAHYLKLDSSKARMHLGWRPRWRLDQALAQTVAWYKAWAAGKDMRALILSQIAAYSEVQAN
jgi:CDP-glucose 4,6-dehydratase